MAASHVHTRLPVCIPKNNCRSANLRSARESFSQSSHPFECGAVRFFLWWLFLHLRLRSENVSSACAEPFALFGGSVQRVPLVFIRMAWEDLSAFPSKAFRLRLRASIESTDRCWFPLPCVTTSVADPFVGLEGRDPRDREGYTLIEFLDQLFVCFIFWRCRKKSCTENHNL